MIIKYGGDLLDVLLISTWKDFECTLSSSCWSNITFPWPTQQLQSLGG